MIYYYFHIMDYSIVHCGHWGPIVRGQGRCVSVWPVVDEVVQQVYDWFVSDVRSK